MVFCGFASGCLVAYVLLPPKKRIVNVPVRVEVPVEVVKYVDRVVEKRIEVPVQVKVPVEVVKYVDRVVEGRVEVPVKKVVNYETEIRTKAPSIANWRRLSNGMSMEQVRNLLGEPTHVSSSFSSVAWVYGKFPHSGSVYFSKNDRGSNDMAVYIWCEPQ